MLCYWWVCAKRWLSFSGSRRELNVNGFRLLAGVNGEGAPVGGNLFLHGEFLALDDQPGILDGFLCYLHPVDFEGNHSPGSFELGIVHVQRLLLAIVGSQRQSRCHDQDGIARHGQSPTKNCIATLTNPPCHFPPDTTPPPP